MATATMPMSVLGQLDPPPRLSVSQWARQAPFIIKEKGAVRPGPYDLDWTPYWREPLDAISDPTVIAMNIVAASQCGKTKMAEVGLAWRALYKPTNMMYLRPTEDDVKEAFVDRFKPMLEANVPALIPAGEWATISKNPAIRLANLIIYGAAATIPRQMTSRTTLYNWYDETDSGSDESNESGNVLQLMKERMMAGSASLVFNLGTSTPRFETGSNWIAFDQFSDKRLYNEPCPHCGHYQPLKLANLKAFDDEKSPDLIRAQDLAFYLCDLCASTIEPSWQGWMADRGRWVPDGQRITEPLPLAHDDIVNHGSLELTLGEDRFNPKTEGPEPTTRHRGYQVWRANTKFDLCRWSNILGEWFTVARTKDPEKLKVFFNNWVAEPWKQAIEPADEEQVKSRIGVYEPRTVPTRVKVILGAVDVQVNCLWFRFRGFGANQESWGIHEGTIEVADDRFDEALDAVYQMAFYDGFRLVDNEADPMFMRAYAIAVDSGYRTDEVYEFARRPAVIAVKGRDTADFRVRVTQVEGKKRPDPLNLYHLNTKVFKDRLQRFIKADDGDPGAFHLHCETTQEYVDQITSEHLARKGNTRAFTWQPKSVGRPNHLLDCEAYILGLAEALEQRRELSIMTIQPTDPQLGVFRRSQHQPESLAAIAPGSRARKRRVTRGEYRRK
jgi:phage terminase large subunit GpA-like protein